MFHVGGFAGAFGFCRVELQPLIPGTYSYTVDGTMFLSVLGDLAETPGGVAVHSAIASLCDNAGYY